MPENRFVPDYGRIAAYRSAGGMGIRLDAGTAFSGAVVTPYYDSLLVKVTAWGRRFADAARGMERCLQEFRVRGVKTNIPFLINLVTHPKFLAGEFTTTFIDDTPELFHMPVRRDRATQAVAVSGRSDRQRQSAGERPAEEHPPRAGAGAAVRSDAAAAAGHRGRSSWNWGRRNSAAGFSSKSGC